MKSVYNTHQRQEVLTYLQNRAGEHVTAADICAFFKESGKPIGTATVVHPRGSFVYLRSSRSTDSTANVLAKVPSGSFVEILSWDVWYCKVRYSGIVGYMVTSYLQGN